jgi:cell fate (sporulation/competence/biofilm development) regulator YlbF (YheA/YmcA/DUF963 family)
MMNIQIDQNYADFLTATEALAENLAPSEPIVVYRDSRERLDADGPAQALLQRLEQFQTEIRANQVRGAVAQADVKRLQTLQREVQSNPAINTYATTQQAAVAYLREINTEISQLLRIDFAALARPSGGCC